MANGLPDGRLVKIGVDHTGLHQITPQQLVEMGFDSADEVAVYGYGGVTGLTFDFNAPCPDGLPEVPTMVTGDGRIVFYAEGPERYNLISSTPGFVYAAIKSNSNTTRGYYFIGRKNDSLHITAADKPAETTGSDVTTHLSIGVYHPQTTNPAHAGATFLGEDISKLPDKTLKITFESPNLKPSTWLGLRLRGGIKAQSPYISYSVGTISKRLNASPLTSNYNDIQTYFGSSNFAETTVQLPATATNDITITTDVLKSGDVAYAAIESATITYTRYNTMPDDGSPLSMYFYNISQGSPIILNNATDGTCVWDVTDPQNPIQLATEIDGDRLTAITGDNHTGSANIIAFNPEANLDAVTTIGEVTLSRLSQMTVPCMVIITAPSLREQAEELAAMHRNYDGMTVAVIEPDEIYNEFGSGAPSPYAIRRFMKSLYDRDPASLRHLLIFGASTYDPCGRISGIPTDDTCVLTYQTEEFSEQGDAARCYANDAFFGLLEDNDTPANIMSAVMSINVSRIPATNSSQAIAYLDKARRYLATPPAIDSYSRALVISDYGDDNGHLKQSIALSDSIEYKWAPHTTVTRAMAALFDSKSSSSSPLLDKVKTTFNNGVGYVAYSGHANPSSLGSDEFIKRAGVSALTNDVYPFTMLSTCYTLAFDRNENGIGEVFLFNDKGGSIAVVGAGRSVVMAYNQYLNIALAEEYFKPTASDCVGDIFRIARNTMLKKYSLRDLITNTACYNLVGDPALPLYRHTHGMTLDLPDTPLTITPLTTNTIKGYITDSDGNRVTDFNGSIILNLYSPEKTEYTDYDKSGCEPLPVTRRETVASTSRGNVTDGAFEVQLHCPAVTEPGSDHRLTVHAIAANGTDRAVAAIGKVAVNELPDDSELDDGTAPTIDTMWLNSPEFNDGDITGPDVTVHATITPSASGLSLIQAIGRTMYLELDQTRYNDIAGRLSFDNDGIATLQYPLTDLADGNHTVSLVVFDNAGNRAENTVSFQVINTGDNITVTVDETTVTTEATISIYSTTSTTEPTGRLIIEDAAGNTVYSRADTSFPFTWDLNDNDGNKVPDGRYTVRAMLKNGMQYTTTPSVTFVIIK